MKPVLTKEQFDRERRFSASVAALNSLQERGLVTASEYKKLRKKLSEKYEPVVGSVFAESLDFPGV